MSKSVRLVLVLAMVSAVAACAKKVDAPVVDDVTVEPASTGKYK